MEFSDIIFSLSSYFFKRMFEIKVNIATNKIKNHSAIQINLSLFKLFHISKYR